MDIRKEPPAPNNEQIAEICKLEEDSANALRLREESWQRSDTDGFLSQWAHGMTARLNERKIEVLKNGGYAEFPVLCDEDGNVVATKIYRFNDGFGGVNRRWKVDNEIYGRTWIPVGAKSRIQYKLHLHEEKRWFKAEVKMLGSGTGLSGCASAYIGVEMVEENK